MQRFNRSSDVSTEARLFDVLDRWCAADRSFGLVAVDLDAFASSGGPRSGLTAERALSASVARLRCASRGGLVAWLGADELVVACDATSAAELTAIADRVVSALAAPVEVGHRQVRINAHVGAALARPGERPEAVLAMAEIARDQARRSGAGTWHLARHTHNFAAA